MREDVDIGVTLTVPAAAPSPTAGVTAAPSPAARLPGPSRLPRTGLDLLLVLIVAVLVVAVGTVLVRAGRRPHHVGI